MDLSMILSPVVEEEAANLRGPTPQESRERARNWSSDELQCAVAILQDFQQPTIEAPTTLQGDVRNDTNSALQARFFPTQKQESKRDENDNVKSFIRRHDDKFLVVADRKVTKKQDERELQHQHAASGVWDDSMSKLYLLVQADAVIKQRRPETSKTHLGDKTQHLRSGVWSRAEEEYAAALVSYFLQGLLELDEGTTLRKFLADELCCSRRRVSMKLATESLAGQQIPRKLGASAFVAAQHPPNEEDRLEVERVLAQLRDANFRTGLEGGRYHSYDGDKSQSLRKNFHPIEAESTEHSIHHHNQMRRSVRVKRKTKRKKPTIIRTGFESPEEEEFVTTMVEFFMAGLLDLPEGTRLVRYLCQQLGSKPKELSMKMAPQYMGELKFPVNVGSITYKRKESGSSSPPNLEKDAFTEELFEVESRLTELRLAYDEAHKKAIPSTVTLAKRKSSAASVSSIETASATSTPEPSPVRSFQRSGPWSHDEEVYAAALIDCFFKGVLDIAEGTTLRAFLSSRLCCNPMRISKKLSSESIAKIRIPKKLGSSTYVLRAKVTPEEQVETEESLQSLQHTYLHSNSRKHNSAQGLKRPRSSISSDARSRATATIDTNLSAIKSNSVARSAASSRLRSKKLQKTKETREAKCQQFQELHLSPKTVTATVLKEQVA